MSYFELLATLPTTAKRNTAPLARVRTLPEEYAQKSQSVLVCVSNLGQELAFRFTCYFQCVGCRDRNFENASPDIDRVVCGFK